MNAFGIAMSGAFHLRGRGNNDRCGLVRSHDRGDWFNGSRNDDRLGRRTANDNRLDRATNDRRLFRSANRILRSRNIAKAAAEQADHGE